jgi:response regulator RpfG family c-di-GMP phosphodiesterase
VGTEQGLEEISKGKGTRFNPAIVDACVHVFHQGEFKFKDVQGGW